VFQEYPNFTGITIYRFSTILSYFAIQRMGRVFQSWWAGRVFKNNEKSIFTPKLAVLPCADSYVHPKLQALYCKLRPAKKWRSSLIFFLVDRRLSDSEMTVHSNSQNLVNIHSMYIKSVHLVYLHRDFRSPMHESSSSNSVD
jgi:hypothetical protein